MSGDGPQPRRKLRHRRRADILRGRHGNVHPHRKEKIRSHAAAYHPRSDDGRRARSPRARHCRRIAPLPPAYSTQPATAKGARTCVSCFARISEVSPHANLIGHSTRSGASPNRPLQNIIHYQPTSVRVKFCVPHEPNPVSVVARRKKHRGPYPTGTGPGDNTLTQRALRPARDPRTRQGSRSARSARPRHRITVRDPARRSRLRRTECYPSRTCRPQNRCGT